MTMIYLFGQIAIIQLFKSDEHQRTLATTAYLCFVAKMESPQWENQILFRGLAFSLQDLTERKFR